MTVQPTPLPFVYGKRPEDLDTLGRCPLLKGLGMKEVATFIDLLDQVAVAPGTCIFREDDATDYAYFVLEGEARLRRGALELRSVGPGGQFGEVALLGGRPQVVTAFAFTTMRLARFSRSRYLALSTQHPLLALHLTQALARSLGDELAAMTSSGGLLAHQRSIPRRLEVRVRRGMDTLVVDTGTLAGTLLPREVDRSLVVAAAVNRKPTSLETALVSDVELAPLTLESWDGRAVYLRSAALLLLEAARRSAPGVVLRVSAPLETGQIIEVTGAVDRPTLAKAVLATMNQMIREDIALRDEVWSTDEARAHLFELGSTDAAQLLMTRRESTVTMAACGETFAVGMGPLVPRASYLRGVSVTAHPMGLLLRLAELEPYMPSARATRIDPMAFETARPRFMGEMSIAQRRWLESLNATSVGAFNQLCVSGHVAELIRVAEGFHEKWIGTIADTIRARRDAINIIAIGGPSSSGKTTFIKRLTVQLLVDGIRPVALSLDDYYVDREKTRRDASGEYDFEAVDALDMALLRSQVGRLLAGERLATARYDFVSGKSLPTGGKEIQLRAGDVLLVEGIHGLNPILFGGVVRPESTFRVFAHPATMPFFDSLSALSSDDVRLLRRLVRDRHHRSYAPAETLLRWPSVRRGELTHIFPLLPHADVIFDTSLVYEISVIKTYAERYLLEIPSSHPAFTTAYRLRKLIDQFVAIHPDHVPPTSVIREFIGGSGFEY